MQTASDDLVAATTEFMSTSQQTLSERLREAVNTRTALLPEFLASATSFGETTLTITYHITCQRSTDSHLPSGSDSVRIDCASNNRDLMERLKTQFGDTVVCDDGNKLTFAADDLLPLIVNYGVMLHDLTPAFKPGVSQPADAKNVAPVRDSTTPSGSPLSDIPVYGQFSRDVPDTPPVVPAA